MTNNNDGATPPEEHSKPSSAPALKDPKTDLDEFLAGVPPEILETIEKLLKQAGEDPSKLRLFEARLKWSQSRHEFLPAEIIEEYEHALPGSAAWLFSRVEAQLAHGQEMDRLRVKGWEKRASNSQLFNFLIAICGIAGATYLAANDGGWLMPTIILAICVGGPVATQIARVITKFVDRTSGTP